MERARGTERLARSSAEACGSQENASMRLHLQVCGENSNHRVWALAVLLRGLDFAQGFSRDRYFAYRVREEPDIRTERRESRFKINIPPSFACP